MLPDQKLDALVTRQTALERDLAAALPAETYVKLSREFAELSPVVEAVRSYRAAQRELDDLISLIADPTTDPEMRSIAEAEKPQVEARRVELERQLRLALVPKDAMDERNVILEIRAGTGGRSEEHTSELQSRQYLVCRLLLEKKKKKRTYQG